MGQRDPCLVEQVYCSLPFLYLLLCHPFRQVPGLHSNPGKKDTTSRQQPQQIKTAPAQRIAAQLASQVCKLNAKGQSGSVQEEQGQYILSPTS